MNSLVSSERGTKAEVMQLQQDNENLQTKLHNLVTARQQDKQNMTLLEKKLIEEKKQKALLETQFAAERKAKKAEEAATARAVAIASASRAAECTDSCKSKRRDLDNDLKQVKRELKLREEQIRQMDRETQVTRYASSVSSDYFVLFLICDLTSLVIPFAPFSSSAL